MQSHDAIVTELAEAEPALYVFDESGLVGSFDAGDSHPINVLHALAVVCVESPPPAPILGLGIVATGRGFHYEGEPGPDMVPLPETEYRVRVISGVTLDGYTTLTFPLVPGAGKRIHESHAHSDGWGGEMVDAALEVLRVTADA